MPTSVLVVDDDRLVRESVRDVLTAKGYIVTTAASAQEAIELVRKLPPDVCLVDIIMPGASGYVACQEIKKIAEQTRVVMMSGGFLGKGDIQLCYQLGADGFIPKPFKLGELLSVIEGRGSEEIPPPPLPAPETAKTAESPAPKNEDVKKAAASAALSEEVRAAAAQPPPETLLITCPECKGVMRVRHDRLVAAKFKFRCPMCDYVYLLKEEQDRYRAAGGMIAGTGRKAKKILVVDDTEFFRHFIHDLLAEQGYTVIEAKSGTEALMEVETEKPELVLSDVLLPGMHGFELCKKIKALPLPYKIKVIFMTGVYKSLSYQQEAQKNYGADGYILKPFQEEDLINKIKEAIGPAQSA